MDSITAKFMLQLFSYGGKSFINSMQMSELLCNVYNAMFQIYVDFRDSKLDAAANALQQASSVYSKSDQQYELNKAVGFLELAYSESKIALDRKKVIKERYFLFFESTTEYDVIPYNQRKEWMLKMADISSSIHLLYKYNRSNLADRWRRTAIEIYSKIIRTYYQITPEELQKISPDYVYIKTTTETERVEYSDILVKYEDVEKYTLTSTYKGDDYIKSQQDILIERFRKVLDNLNFEL